MKKVKLDRNKIKLDKKFKNEPKTIDENGIMLGVTEVLSKYLEEDFVKVKDNIEIDLKNFFKKYKNVKYNGYKTQLGMLEDLIVLWEWVDENKN